MEESFEECDVCEQPAFHKCKGCDLAVYCSKQCQKLEWDEHKDICHLECGMDKQDEDSYMDYYDSNSDEDMNSEDLDMNSEDLDMNNEDYWKKTGESLGDKWRRWRLRKSRRMTRRERRKARKERRKSRKERRKEALRSIFKK